MSLLPRRDRPPLRPQAGERTLAWMRADDGTVLLASADALYVRAPEPVRPLDSEPATSVVEVQRTAWQLIETAQWDAEAETLEVVEVPHAEGRVTGTADGAQTRTLALGGGDAARRRRLLQVLRERVTASVALHRRVRVDGGAVHVVARRRPGGTDLRWWVRYDAGVDPDAPEVAAATASALAQARDDLGA